MLRLAHPLASLRATRHNGPGLRISIWFQGCALRCTTRCLNPAFLSPDRGVLVPTSELERTVLEIARAEPEVEGVTLLGGEPTDQAPDLGLLLGRLRAAGLSTMLYSGHRHEALQVDDRPGVRALLEVVDLLVDGPFLEAKYDEELAWRGSSNQRLLPLSGRYEPDSLESAFARQGKGWSLSVSAAGLVSVSGLQERSGAARVESMIRRRNAPRAGKRGLSE